MPRLSMRFLGGLQVSLDREPVSLEYDKVRALLAYLAIEADRPHRREALAGLLWPNLGERRARHNLSQALLVLRRALGEGEQPFVLATPDAIQFDASSDHQLDVSTFCSLLEACRAHPHWRLETCPSCGERLERASELYMGPFLQGFSLEDSPAFEVWQVVRRERLHHQAADALRALAQGCDHRGERAAALRHAERWAALDPWHEGAQRQLMRALALTGRRAEALAQYEGCRQLLRDELRVDPAQETAALYDLIRDQGPLPALYPSLPNNLPAPVTPFVDRGDLLDEIAHALQEPDCRLLTLVGPGGSGKTRLALQTGRKVVASAPADCFADGVYWVPLATVRGADGIVPAIAQALDIELEPGQDPRRCLLAALRRKRLLLILDNYEHLLDGSEGEEFSGAGAASEILGAARGVQLLVTSRARLNVLAERALPVGGMSFPSSRSEDGQELTRHSGVALFLERAQAARPGYAPLGRDLAEVGCLCRLVAGMPLAIVLAASWIDVLSVGEIADRVATNLDLLEADLGDLPLRQRSMRAVFDASWAILSEQAQRAFARLSVFVGGFTEEAAREVAGAGLPVLRELARTSFVERTEGGRFEIHELMRQYGASKLAASPVEQEAARDRHCAYYAAFYARRASEVWRTGLGLVEPELDNVRVAWHWGLEHARTAQIRSFLGRLIGGIQQLYPALGGPEEARGRFGQAVHVLRSATDDRENEVALAIALRSRVCFGSSPNLREERLSLIRESTAILKRLGEKEELAFSKICAATCLPRRKGDEIERLLQEGLSLAREVGCQYGIGWASHLLAGLAQQRRDDAQGEVYLWDAYKAFRRIEHDEGASWVLDALARLAAVRGDLAGARALATECLSLCQRLGRRRWSVRQLLLLGQVALAQGATDEARERYLGARIAAQEIDDDRWVVPALCGLGDVALINGDVEGAQAQCCTALEIAAASSLLEPRGRAVLSLAALAAHKGRAEHAVTLVALVEHAMTRPSAAMADESLSWWVDLRPIGESLYAELQGRLTPAAFTIAQERGRSMDLCATAQELFEELRT